MASSPNVVFPTAIDPRGEDDADVFYGMADTRIGAFRLTMGPVPLSAGGPPRRSPGPPCPPGDHPGGPPDPPAHRGTRRGDRAPPGPWPTSWPEVDRAVERLRDGVAEAVGDELVGLYLHGSLALGDFYPPASDVDFHVATAGTLGEPAPWATCAPSTPASRPRAAGWPGWRASTCRRRRCAATTRTAAAAQRSGRTGLPLDAPGPSLGLDPLGHPRARRGRGRPRPAAADRPDRPPPNSGPRSWPRCWATGPNGSNQGRSGLAASAQLPGVRGPDHVP